MANSSDHPFVTPREQEKRYRIIFEETLNPVMVVDEEGRYIDANPAALAFFECEKEELLGKTVWEFCPPEQLEKQRAEHSPFLSPRTVETEYLVRGKIKTLLLNVVPHSYSEKTVLLGIGVDITERKHLEWESRENQQLIDSVFTAIQDGISVLNRDLTIRYVNQPMKNWYRENALLEGKKCFEAYHNRPIPCDPCPTIRCLKTGKTEREVVSAPPDAPIEWVEVFSYPIKDPETGEITGVVEFVRDITERKRADVALRESEERYRSLVSALHEGIILQDRSGKITACNLAAQKILGMSEEEILGETSISRDWSLFHEDGTPCSGHEHPSMRTLQTGSPCSNEVMELRRKRDGQKLWLRVNTRPIFQPGESKPQAVVISFVDITSQKEAEELLRKGEEELRWLFKSMINAFAIHECVFDEEGRVVDIRLFYFNEAYERLMEVRLEDVKGKTVQEVWPGTEEEWIRHYGEVATSGIPQSFDLFHAPTDKYYHCNVYRPWDTPDRFCVIFEDITDRKRAEEREYYLKQMLLAIRNVNQLIVQENDPHRLIERACENLTETLGYYNAWIALFNSTGKVTDVASSGFKCGFDTLRERLIKGVFLPCMNVVLKQAHIVVVDDPYTECRECPLSPEYEGRSGWAARLAFEDRVYGILVVSIPGHFVHDEEAQDLFRELSGDLGFALHKIAEAEKYRVIQERYRHLVENAAEGIAVVQEEKIVYVNPALSEISGYDEKTLLSTLFMEFIQPEDREKAAMVYNDIISGKGQLTRFPLRFINKKGETRWIELNTASIEWEDNPAYLSMVQDITERKKAEEDLRERVKEQACLYSVSRLLTDIEHSMEDISRQVAGIVASSMQYTDEAAVCLKVDGKVYGENLVSAPAVLMAEITVAGRTRGFLKVSYAHDREFLPQEQDMIDTIALAFGQWLERKEATENLQKAHRLLTDAQAIAQLGGWEYDVATGRIDWTDEVYRIYGVGRDYNPSDIGKDISFYAPEDQHLVEKAFRQAIDEGQPYDLEVRFTRADGEHRWVRTMGKPVIEKDRVVRITGNIMDITERKETDERIRHLSFHDSLTDLYNRAFIEEELQRLGDSRELPLGVMLCDVNGLKLINDAFGHKKGDELLRRFANILRKSYRKEDLIGRWGGDEFILLLPGMERMEMRELARRIKKHCKQASTEDLPLSVSFGWTVKTTSQQSTDTVITQAEERMYRNKLTESRSTRSAIIASLERSLRETTQETEEHANRMAEMSQKVGEALGLRDDDIHDLMLLSRLHDLGKIAIPKHILNKPSSLTAKEWETVKKHPEVGYRIAESSPDLLPIAEAILAHHERWDGTGYPQGLRGEAISILARILAVVDAFDVMTNGRPYKEPMSTAQALEELKRCAGSQFDPEVVEVFVKMVKN